jgi:hypothetical protein
MMNGSDALNVEYPAIRKTRHSRYSSFWFWFIYFLPIAVMAQSAKELSKLSKERLIEMAVAKVDEPSFRITDFSSIEIWLDEDELTVEFEHAIRFIPKRGQFYYSVSVDLISGSTVHSIKGNGPDNEDIQFYDPAKFKDQIKFVFDAINSPDSEIGKIPEGKLPDGTMTIQEEAGYYDVEVDSYSTHSYYKIKKGTGKIYDAGHKHYDRSGSDSKRKQIY